MVLEDELSSSSIVMGDGMPSSTMDLDDDLASSALDLSSSSMTFLMTSGRKDRSQPKRTVDCFFLDQTFSSPSHTLDWKLKKYRKVSNYLQVDILHVAKTIDLTVKGYKNAISSWKQGKPIKKLWARYLIYFIWTLYLCVSQLIIKKFKNK